jgi:hypothetical protein
MNIPIEIVEASFVAIIALQSWALKEIIALKVKVAKVDELERRVTKLEALEEKA